MLAASPPRSLRRSGWTCLALSAAPSLWQSHQKISVSRARPAPLRGVRSPSLCPERSETAGQELSAPQRMKWGFYWGRV